ncbi:MAG TPA: DUF192 domain-containing protein, partial [Thermoanaerobaculia bacterium]|nr:DUF192 domain-containing protein [Thermoanaerobaculia bacterium]
LTCAKPVTTTNTTPPSRQPHSGPVVVLPDGYPVKIELATDDETRAQGLMYRERVPAGTGMLFMFAQAGDYPFWMKNTLVPLDMIWIDAAKKVVHVAANVPPCKADPCPSYPPNAEASYVLELGGGEAAKHGVVNGATLTFERLGNVVLR